ncbi:hypothetical protein RIVM261_080740 [Rivularia sp. IAM M-261]|nr:hypothetical protein RIVM261_080740 [Rivularia sp. IAM M-261]
MKFEVKQEDIEDGYAEFVIGNMRLNPLKFQAQERTIYRFK